MSLQAIRYLEFLAKILIEGRKVSPRGLDILELEDHQLIVDPSEPFMNFVDRKYPLNYFKKEMMWKLGANPYDESIKEHAAMWKQVQNPDGTFNSNYGQYWFGHQMGIWSVVTELIRDKWSRRAVIPMLNTDHMKPEVKDTVCTECVGFRIRPTGNSLELNMSVHMRSSDVIFGLGTDIPTFAFLYRLVAGLLSAHYGPMMVGTMTITAMSSHIYEPHWRMVSSIVDKGVQGYSPIPMPYTKVMEAMYLIAKRGKFDEEVPQSYYLTNWLLS